MLFEKFFHNAGAHSRAKMPEFERTIYLKSLTDASALGLHGDGVLVKTIEVSETILLSGLQPLSC
jgi:hypothetical protein